MEKFINEKLKSSLKVASARTAFERFTTVDVKPGQGNAEEIFKFDLPGWDDMRDGVSIKGQPQGGPYADPVTKEAGGFRPVRNELFKKYSTRTAAAGGELLDLHQVHAVLAQLPGCVFRRHPGRNLRRQPRSRAAVAAFAKRFAR